MLEYSFSRLFVPWNIRSHDGTFVPWTNRSLELLFSRLFVPWNIRSLELLFPGPFVPWTIRSGERINTANKDCRPFPRRTIHFIPWSVHSLELSFQVPGPFLPRTIRSFISRAVPGARPLTKKEQRNKQKCRLSPMTATVHSRYTQTVDRRYSASRLNWFSSAQWMRFTYIHIKVLFIEQYFWNTTLQIKKSTMSVCVVCKANVTGRQHALECDACGLWCQGRSQGNEFSA